MNWQPIETAPKDGTEVDLWCVDRGDPGGRKARRPNCAWGLMQNWIGAEFKGWRGVGQQHRQWEPTHWMPIPAPPSGDA